ncbi:MAG: hypothetical protein JXQ90_18620 [Cyclobacteriaceae bacterium]
MRMISRIINWLFLIGSWLWLCHLYKLFFDFRIQDGLGILALMLIAAILSFKFKIKSGSWLSLPASIGLVAGSYQSISLTLIHSHYAWLIIYAIAIVLALLSFTLSELKFSSLAYLTSALLTYAMYDHNEAQSGYFDRLVATKQTRQGEIHITQWKNDYWLHYNNQLQYSTVDRHVYAEAFVMPAMHLIKPNNILLIGGDNGLIEHTLSQWDEVSIDIVPYDTAFSNFMRIQPLIEIKKSDKIAIQKMTIWELVNQTDQLYDLIIVDVPDPQHPEYAQYYTREFYDKCHRILKANGGIVIQLGNPYTTPQDYASLHRTLAVNSFVTIDYFAQIPTIGQWGWAIGVKDMSADELTAKTKSLSPLIPTKWWNNEAMQMMLGHGKASYFGYTSDTVISIGTTHLLTGN